MDFQPPQQTELLLVKMNQRLLTSWTVFMI